MGAGEETTSRKPGSEKEVLAPSYRSPAASVGAPQDPMTSPSLPQECRQLSTTDLTVVENLEQKAGTNHLACVDRDDCHPAVRMTQVVMTSLYTHDLEPRLPKCCDEFPASDSWELAHRLTATF